ncbi:MAG: hypothetical protein WD025_08730 [Bacteriovoracaceae bacterium]
MEIIKEGKEKNKEEKKEKQKEERKERGRRLKNKREVYKLNKEQGKFFIDLTKDEKDLKLVQDLLVKSNKKNHGKEITVKELSVYGMKRLNQKDLEKIQEDSLTEMEKVQRSLDLYNKKNNSTLELGEYLVKKLNIN